MGILNELSSPADLKALVLTVLIDQVAEILGIDPDDVIPDN